MPKAAWVAVTAVRFPTAGSGGRRKNHHLSDQKGTEQGQIFHLNSRAASRLLVGKLNPITVQRVEATAIISLSPETCWSLQNYKEPEI